MYFLSSWEDCTHSWTYFLYLGHGNIFREVLSMGYLLVGLFVHKAIRIMSDSLTRIFFSLIFWVFVVGICSYGYGSLGIETYFFIIFIHHKVNL
jgi:hypothetical protein